MAPSYSKQLPSLDFVSNPDLFHALLHFLIPPHIFPTMNPAQQHAPSSEELHLTALEQALADSKAREIETQKTLELLTNGFQLLQDLVLKHIPLCTSLKTPFTDTICYDFTSTCVEHTFFISNILLTCFSL